MRICQISGNCLKPYSISAPIPVKVSILSMGHRPEFVPGIPNAHGPAAPTRIFCPIIFITSSPITQPTPPRIKAPTKQTTRIIIVASRLFPRQTLQKQLSTLQKRTFTTSTVRMVNLVTSVSDFKSSIKSGVSVVDFYATWCGPCKVISPDPPTTRLSSSDAWFDEEC